MLVVHILWFCAPRVRQMCTTNHRKKQWLFLLFYVLKIAISGKTSCYCLRPVLTGHAEKIFIPPAYPLTRVDFMFFQVFIFSPLDSPYKAQNRRQGKLLQAFLILGHNIWMTWLHLWLAHNGLEPLAVLLFSRGFFFCHFIWSFLHGLRLLLPPLCWQAEKA